MRMFVLMLLTLLCFLGNQQLSQAMTIQSESSFKQKAHKGADQPTGLFGGIKPDGTFVFKLSESKGIRFYRLASNVRLSGFPDGQTLQNLAVNTPIRLIVENYRVSVVEALGGQP